MFTFYSQCGIDDDVDDVLSLSAAISKHISFTLIISIRNKSQKDPSLQSWFFFFRLDDDVFS